MLAITGRVPVVVSQLRALLGRKGVLGLEPPRDIPRVVAELLVSIAAETGTEAFAACWVTVLSTSW